MMKGMNWKLKNAADGFRPKRANFYLDLASVMEASPGESVSKILSRYAERYKKKPIGILARHWLERFAQVGTFTESLRGTIPDEDLATISAAESTGDLRLGLEKLGANLLAMKETGNEIQKLMISALIMVVVFHGFLAIQAFMVMPKLEAAAKAGRLEVRELGRAGVVLINGAHVVHDWWWAWFILVAGAAALVIWALKNYVGKYRGWLDNHLLPFRMARDFNAATFFSTVGMITTPRNNNVVHLNDALVQVRMNAYPWLRWQITKILDNFTANPNSKGEIFNTGIANEATYYRILDISDYAEMPEMLQKIGDVILKTAPQEIKAQATVLRIVLMGLCLITMLSIYGGTIVMVNTFKAAVTMKASFH
jgi:type II secretory pathway component PulF